MSQLTAIRHRQHRVSRLVAALFAIGWLGFAVAPCQASPLDESMPADDCGHCPIAPSDLDNSCTSVAAPECMTEGLTLLERRDIESPQSSAAPPSAFPNIDAFIPDRGLLRDTRARRLLLSHVSIQQRYCTYLN